MPTTPRCSTSCQPSEAPRPSALALAANFAVNTMLRRALEATPIDQAQLQATLALATQDKVAFDEKTAQLSRRPAHDRSNA